MRLREAKTLFLTFFFTLFLNPIFAFSYTLEDDSIFAFSSRPEDDWKEKTIQRLDSLLSDSLLQTTQLGLCIYDLTEDQPFFQYNANQRMRPASCQKVVTAVSALHFLSADYSFKTRLFMTGEIKEDSVLEGDLFVVGGMDPLLSKADVQALAQVLQQKGVKELKGNMFVDRSMKDSNPLGWGWCWDDEYGPLDVLTVDGNNNFEEEWLALFNNPPIEIAQSECPANAVLLAEISHKVSDVLPRMMKESDNIYAESLFYLLAASSGEKGAGRKQAEAFINQLIDSLGLQSSDYQIADGSGLSLYNYLSPTLLVSFLQHAFQQPKIINHLLPSLPIAAVDGTLKRRLPKTAVAGNLRAKTGSVTGVSSLSGFIKAGNGHQLCFSIINQGIARGADGKSFQDKVCLLLVDKGI